MIDRVLAVADEFGDRADTPASARRPAMPNALANVIFWSVTNFSRSFGMMIGRVVPCRSDSQCAHLGLTHPVRTLKFERLRHNADGQNPLVVRQICAMIEAAPVAFVRAAHTGGDEHHIGSVEGLEMAFLDSSADFWPISGLEPAPMPPVSFSPIWILFCTSTCSDPAYRC
ncbi:MAG: hypothetical protein ACLR8U_02095 [Oscillospiraceae bacterium]